MNVFALIPARAGSKGIPNKNLIDLNNHPLISYSITTALNCDFIDEVIVTSNSERILNVAREYGSGTLKRPENISNDLSRDVEFVKHFFESQNQVKKEDIVVLLRPTHPIRNVNLIRQAFELFNTSRNFDSLRSMKKSEEIPFKKWIIDINGAAVPIINSWPNILDLSNAPRQILPQTYYQDGYVDIFPIETVLNFDSTCGPKVKPFVISDFSHDIDNYSDLEVVSNFLQTDKIPLWFIPPTKIVK